MKNLLLVGFALALFIVVSASIVLLVGELSRGPSVVLSDTTCTPPCWNGITPGASTFDDVSSMLFASENIDQDSISGRDRGGAVQQVWWHFEYPVRDSSGRIYFAEDVVAAILIGTYGSVTLEEILALLGEPSSWWTHCTAEGGVSWTQTVLIWAEGYSVVVDHDPPCPSEEPLALSASDRVAQVIYFEPTGLGEVLRRHSLFGLDSEGAMEEAAPWSPAFLAP